MMVHLVMANCRTGAHTVFGWNNNGKNPESDNRDSLTRKKIKVILDMKPII